MQTNENKVILTIVIPIYNVEKYLAACLSSVYAIKKISTEIILINDGSTDNSQVIINQFLAEFKDKTLFIDQKNRGLSASRNEGIERATGEFILFVDSDDLIDPTKVEFVVNYAKENRLDLVQTKSKTFGDGAPRELPIPSDMLELPVSNGRDYLHAYCNSASIKNRDFRPEVWLLLVKKSVLLGNNLRFQEDMYFEDELMTPSIIFHCDRVKMLDCIFYHYRTRPGSIMTTCNEYHVQSKAKLVASYFDMIKENGFHHEFLNCRLIGWCQEGLVYLSFKQLFVMFSLKKINAKNVARLLILISQKCFTLLPKKAGK